MTFPWLPLESRPRRYVPPWLSEYWWFLGGFWFFFIFSFLHLTAGILLFARAVKVIDLRQAGLCDSVTLTAEEPALGCALGANLVISWQLGAGAQAAFWALGIHLSNWTEPTLKRSLC